MIFVFVFFAILIGDNSGRALPSVCKCSHGVQGEVTVDCSDGDLTAVPTDIPTNVTTLILRHNNISLIPSYTFQNLSFLENLDLSFNHIKKLEVRVFFGLKSLVNLNLAGNYLSMNNISFPDSVFKDLNNLKALKVNNNTGGGSGYPDVAFSHVTSLEILQMDGLFNIPFGPGFGNLTNLRVLDFNGYEGNCNINNITEDLFYNIATRQPLTLNVSRCAITDIDPLAFKNLPTLEVLDLKENDRLSFENLMIGSVGFQHTSLKVLNITTINPRGHLYTLHGRYFQHLSKTNITEVVMEHSNIVCIDPIAMTYLPNTLEYLSVRDNRLVAADFLARLIFKPKIKSIDIGLQVHSSKTGSPERISTGPSQYCDHSSSQDNKHRRFNLTVPSAKMIGRSHDEIQYSAKPTTVDTSQRELLNVGRTTCETSVGDAAFFDIPFPIPLPFSLRTIIADSLKLGYAVPVLKFGPINNLTFLNLSSSLLYCLGGPVYGLHELQVFDLSSNQANDINPLFLSDMPRLTHLYLHDNNLGYALSLDADGQTFSSQTNLRYLGLKKNRLRTLPEKLFKNLGRLRHTVLSQNSLSSISSRIGHMKGLRFLDLSFNELVGLDSNLCRDLDQISKSSEVTVDITGNALLRCGCHTLDFVQWVAETKVIIKNINQTTCILPDMSVIKLSDVQQVLPTLWFHCNNEDIFISVLIVFVCLLIILNVSGTLYYKRWRLRYLYYIGRKRVSPFNSLGHPLPVEQLLDVFISYDEDEPRWRRFVQEELLERLEQNGISCLVSEIHFLSGRPMREVIEGAVLGSRKTLALLTNDFFKSRDRELEFNMAVLHGLETRQDIIIPVAMETLDADSFPVEARSFLEAHQPISYVDEGFWIELVTKVKAAL